MEIQSDIAGLAELKRLAEAADKDGQHICMHPRDANNWAANTAFVVAADPQTVSRLIAENEELRARENTTACRLEMSEDTLRTIRRCLHQAEGDVDQLWEQVDALRLFLSACYPVSAEIDKRGYRWCEAYLDQALDAARKTMTEATGQ